MSTKNKLNKYRPSLTSDDILHIISLAKLEQPAISTASISVISKLAPFQAKIENEGLTASNANTELIDIAETVFNSAIKAGHLSKEVYWQNCYNKWEDTPTFCSLDEIIGANEHRYLNDLMSPEEAVEFEAKSDKDKI
jgi:hypothetical protein